MINYMLSLFLALLLSTNLIANSDSLSQKQWIRNKVAFGRSQHIQYLGGKNKTNTLFNKAYYGSFTPINIKGVKPFIALSYEYFFTKATCYNCAIIDPGFIPLKALHYIHFASIGAGVSYEFRLKNKKGKEVEFIIGASIEQYLFKRAFIFRNEGLIDKTTPFIGTHPFFNRYFFKDLIGVRVYNSIDYKVAIQLSGLLLRNERLNYAPSRHTFHNFMLGFNVYLK